MKIQMHLIKNGCDVMVRLGRGQMSVWGAYTHELSRTARDCCLGLAAPGTSTASTARPAPRWHSTAITTLTLWCVCEAWGA